MKNLNRLGTVDVDAIILWLDRAAFVCLCALVFILPVSTAGVEIFGSLAVLFFLMNRGLTARQKGVGALIPTGVSLRIAIPLLVFLAMCGMSILWSVDPQLSFRAFAGKSVGAALLFWTAAGTFTSRARLLRLGGVLLASAFIVSLDGFWQLWQGHDLFKGEALSGGRVCAAMRHPNGFGAYLLFAILPAFALTCWSLTREAHGLFNSWRGRLLLVGLTVVLCAAIGFTFSRGAWIGLFAGVVVLIVLRPGYFLPLALAAGLFLIIFSPLIISLRHVGVLSDSPSVTNIFDTTNINGTGRIGFWKDALRVIAEHPAGTGLNTYTTVIRQYPVAWRAYPHNSYLQMAAEIGAVGLTVFLWFIWSFIWQTAGRIRRFRHDVTGALITGLLAGWVGVMVQSGLDTTFYSVQLSRMLWLMMGLLLAAVLIESKDSPEPETKA